MCAPRLIACLIVLATGITSGSRAQQQAGQTATATPATDAEITKGAAALLDHYRELGWFNGSVLVARGDTSLYRGAAGHAALDHPARLTEDSPMRIAGLSQLFTVVLALKMVEQSVIALDDPIGKVMTGWPEAYKPITIRQLLLGTSGVRDVTAIPEFVRTIAVPRTLHELTQVILKETPVAPPGTFGRAQNSDYHLLAAVLETAGGAPFDTLLRRHILAPLKLDHTRYDDPNAVIPGRAIGMSRREGVLRHATWFHMSNAVGMAHLVSTPADVHRFVRAFLDGRIVSRALVNEAITGHVSQLPPGITLPAGVSVLGVPMRGFGWTVVSEQLSHVTGLNGAAAVLYVTPSTGVMIIVLSNAGSGEANTVAAALQSLVLGNPQPLPIKRTAVPLSQDDIAQMRGTWNIPNSAALGGPAGPITVVVRSDGPRVFVRYAGGAEAEWLSDGRGRLFDPNADRQFTLGSSVGTATFRNQGRDIALVKAQ